MWQIVINGPGYFDTPYDLPEEGIATLGRAEENDIVLSGDMVSRKHARLEVRAKRVTIEDLGSRNGVQVNGRPIHAPTTVGTGDTVSLGENSLTLRESTAVERIRTDVLGSGGTVRRVKKKLDVSSMVILAKDLSRSAVMRALDNVVPFDAAEIAPATADGPIAFESLLILYKAAERLNTAKNLKDFLNDTVDRLMARVSASTAVVLLGPAGGGKLQPAVVRHHGKLGANEVPISDAIVDEALQKGAALAVADVRSDRRFSERESVVLYNAEQVLCIPIGKPPYAGVLYLNRRGGGQGELEEILDVCNAVANLIATGIEKFRTREDPPQKVRLQEVFERFHAPHIVKKRIADLERSGGGELTQMEVCTVTSLYGQLVGLGALVEKMKPEKLVVVLNEFYGRMSRLIFSFEGTVDKFSGDAVAAIFGAPYSKGDDAIRAVRCALAMRAEWEKFMATRPAKERSLLRVGINTGKALVGTVGWQARLDYTALGESVAVPALLCHLGKEGQVLMTGKTLASTGARFEVSPRGEQLLVGVREKVPVFEVLEEDMEQHTQPGG